MTDRGTTSFLFWELYLNPEAQSGKNQDSKNQQNCTKNIKMKIHINMDIDILYIVKHTHISPYQYFYRPRHTYIYIPSTHTYICRPIEKYTSLYLFIYRYTLSL